jgi:hypothetical protein
MRSSLRSISSRRRRISERLLAAVMNSPREEAPAGGDGGHDRLGPKLAEQINLGPCSAAVGETSEETHSFLSHHRLDRYRLVALTRLWVLLVHARELSSDANRVPNNPAVPSLAL